MKVAVDNLDGRGAVDYSQALVWPGAKAAGASGAVRLERKLHAPSLCRFTVLAGTVAGKDSQVAAWPATPVRNGRVVVTSDAGTVLFTGYVARAPLMELAGTGVAGAVYVAAVEALSDEVLLDRQAIPQTSGTSGQAAGDVLTALTTRVDAARFTTTVDGQTVMLGQFAASAGESWSHNAADLARMSRTSYRVVNGTVSMAPVGATVHVLTEADGSLQVNALTVAEVRTLANDVTVCGEIEPVAYATEFFQGDGLTLTFDLTHAPFEATAGRSKPLVELFQMAALDKRVWSVSDPGGNLSLTAAGLTSNGGTGVDGHTLVTAIDRVELGGFVMLEASGVSLRTGSDALLCGLYRGPVDIENCEAGFRVKQINGGTVVVPVITGAEAGSTFLPVMGHLYTLRMRICAPEVERLLATYCGMNDEGGVAFGGNLVASNARLTLEVQDTTQGVVTDPVVLFDGAPTSTPGSCLYCVLDSVNFLGSVRSTRVTRRGPMWVTSTPLGGSPSTRRIGTAVERGECQVSGVKLSFAKEQVPAVGELVEVCYRTRGRAVARLENAAGKAAEASSSNGMTPGTARWAGTVSSPTARSAADCENAARALLALAGSRVGAWQGRYTAVNPSADVWPGDVLALASGTALVNAMVVVRSVTVTTEATVPETLMYSIAFANDWAEPLAINAHSSVPADAWLPSDPQKSAPLASLQGLVVTGVTASTVTVAVGVLAPPGGGFEVRRRDFAFGPGMDSDLVLRSPVGNFTIPRAAAMEEFYVRMFDGQTPPGYSRYSSAVIVNVPMN